MSCTETRLCGSLIANRKDSRYGILIDRPTDCTCAHDGRDYLPVLPQSRNWMDSTDDGLHSHDCGPDIHDPFEFAVATRP
jgi:hypothetical protein